MEPERIKEIAVIMESIVTNVNTITNDDIDEILRDLSVEESLGPLLHPSDYQGGRFERNHQFRKVLTALKGFKTTVSGIGNFR